MRSIRAPPLHLFVIFSDKTADAFLSPCPCTGTKSDGFRLSAKRNRKDGSKLSKHQRRGTKNIHVSGGDVSVSPATQRTPATLMGIEEDHRFEQFFYDDVSASQLWSVVDIYERPLLMCNPTLAVQAEKKGKPYRLLDRDTRFSFLSGFVKFSLTEPHLVDFDFDAVFIDPPFANVSPEQIARCLRLISADSVPLFVAYNSRREDSLLRAMNQLDCPNLERKFSLKYKEGVSEDTQDCIWLYGPAQL